MAARALQQIPMTEPKPQLILPVGTRIVTRSEVRADTERPHRPVGSVAEIIAVPVDTLHSYRVRFADGGEASLRRKEFSILSAYKAGETGMPTEAEQDLQPYVIYRCVVGSRAYGLETDQSDTDRRGIFLPPARLHWSLHGVPEQLENHDTQECYWELEKFLDLALRANPNVLECLFTPLVEYATPLAQELLSMRDAFLSRLAYQTFNGYVLSQFRKLEQDLRAKGEIRWKHVMHMIRLLLSGIALLRDGELPVDVGAHRERLLAVRAGSMPWDEVEAWRHRLHRELDDAYGVTRLPARPDYQAADRFLVGARASAVDLHASPLVNPAAATGDLDPMPSSGPLANARPDAVRGGVAADARLAAVAAAQPYPLLFATISGAHLYGFPSPDSDFDLRGVHVLPPEAVVGLREGPDTIEVNDCRSDFELDLVTHDAKKFFNLLLRRNGYVLEQLYSPLVVCSSPEHEELKHIARGCITRHHSHHYLGFARTQWELFCKEQPRRCKPLLYVYRVLLTGIHLLRTGGLEASLVRLNDVFQLPYLPELIARKVQGAEHGSLPDRDLTFHESEYRRLLADLETAARDSRLPPAPSAGPALHDLLVRIRLGAGKPC
jgi:uncharacterized protein